MKGGNMIKDIEALRWREVWAISVALIAAGVFVGATASLIF
jgi:hypothetical protein